MGGEKKIDKDREEHPRGPSLQWGGILRNCAYVGEYYMEQGERGGLLGDSGDDIVDRGALLE
jgi:hypothetical protein